MTLERYFNLSSYLLLTTGTAMLFATRQLDPLSLGAFSIALLAACLIDCGWGRWWEPKAWVNWLLLGWLAFSFADWYFLEAALPTVVIRFILFTVALRLLRVKRERDWLWLYTVSFLQVLFAAGLMLDTVFLILLIVYLFAALSTLVSFELQRAQNSFAESHPEQPLHTPHYWRLSSTTTAKIPPALTRKPLRPPRWRNISVFASASLLLIFLLAAPLFLAMPRLARAFPTNLLRSEGLSGFSETVRLGEVGRIKLSPQVVMRVRVKFPHGREKQWLRWRGLALDYYENGNWIRTVPAPGPVKDLDFGFELAPRQWPVPYTEQEFYLEPINLGILFAAPSAIRVHGIDFLRRDMSDTLVTDSALIYRLRYTVLSDTREPDPAALQVDGSRYYSSDIKRYYLQMPQARDARVDKLAETVTRGATSPYEMARRLEQHLQNSYQYSLDLQPVEEGDPVADFLFNTRTGHCEYFASAMVLMLRSRGIPARLVNGFQMGEYSAAADAYTVRQSDAHSWVEAYFPPHGWVTFDPTPNAGLNTYEEDALAWLRHYSDALQMFWQERVVGFDTGEQLSLLLAAQRQLRRLRVDSDVRWWEWRQRLVRWFEGNRLLTTETGDAANPPAPAAPTTATKPWLPFLLALAAGTALLWWRYRQSWGYRFRRDATRSAIAFYQEMLDALARAGRRKAPAQTPLEFAAQVNHPAVLELTQLYQQARFGQGGLQAGEIARVSQLLAELKQSAPQLSKGLQKATG